LVKIAERDIQATSGECHPTPLTLFVNLKEVLMRQRFVVITSFITKVVRTKKQKEKTGMLNE
jgi:hypothetical protein